MKKIILFISLCSWSFVYSQDLTKGLGELTTALNQLLGKLSGKPAPTPGPGGKPPQTPPPSAITTLNPPKKLSMQEGTFVKQWIFAASRRAAIMALSFEDFLDSYNDLIDNYGKKTEDEKKNIYLLHEHITNDKHIEALNVYDQLRPSDDDDDDDDN